LWFAIRAKQFDDKVNAYIAERPQHLPIRKKMNNAAALLGNNNGSKNYRLELVAFRLRTFTAADDVMCVVAS
jgi:hypothetical protein